MKYVLAVFMSRRDAMAFGQALSQVGVRAWAVNTPASLVAGCSLSVKFPQGAIDRAQRVLARGDYQSFRGFYAV